MDHLSAFVENFAWLSLAFVFVLGTIIGSFLNVVVFRLPSGMNLLYPASRCPECQHSIRWFDNVPILGWLWLRGRCRDCNTAISPRYPLVELLVGLVFLTFWWIDYIIPVSAAHEAVLAAMFNAQPEPEIHTELFFAGFVFHVLLLCALLAAALIDSDGHRLPRRLITWPAAAGILLAFAFPAVQTLSVNFARHQSTSSASMWALVTALVGLITAVVIRLAVLNFLGFQRPREIGLLSATLALYAVGAFLGWQACLAIGFVAVVWSLITQATKLRSSIGRLQPTSLLFIATLIWCACVG